MKDILPFNKSDSGAHASWKGYSSQTLYIATRIVEDQASFEYFPEQLEDLMIKHNGEVTEIIQIKDIGSNMSISNLASTDSSMNNEGFFRRVLSLRKMESLPLVAKVIYFGDLGDEPTGFTEKAIVSIKNIKDKLMKNHGLLMEEAEWLMDRMVFEKVDKLILQTKISDQIRSYIPTMIAPTIMQDLLIQYVSDLSKTKGFTSRVIWQEKVLRIGKDMASLDGYFREYGSSLIRLSDIITHKNYEELRIEYEQGISAHPAHIRFLFDFERTNWLEQIEATLIRKKAVIVKGASGQGKSSLCYKYLINKFPEEIVYCVRQIKTQDQAENLVKAILGLTKHSDNIALYIDVNPGQTHWTWLLRELQIRGIDLPIIVSIREEDFKRSNVDMSEVTFGLIELSLSEEEAMNIFNKITKDSPHKTFRSFGEAWQQFGSEGPLLEFVYLLNNNETLKQRLSAQINRLIDESPDDSWLNLLLLACYVGKLDSPLLFEKAKEVVKCTNIIAALKRMSNEYLIRSSNDGKFIEALHPLRADIIYNILQKQMFYDEKELLLQSLGCVENHFPQMLLFHYFTSNELDLELITNIAKLEYSDWTSYASVLNTMLWLDIKQYIEQNKEVFNRLFLEKGAGWNCFIPMDITGEILPGEFMATNLAQFNSKILPYLKQIKKSFTGYVLLYSVTDMWLEISSIPEEIPVNDLGWSSFGYTLFWLALRKKKVRMLYTDQEIISVMSKGSIASKVDAVCGIYKQGLSSLYNKCELILRERIINHHNIVLMNITESEVECRFVPPFFQKNNENEKVKNLNHFWTMNMIKLLSRLYPSKITIAVKLVGIDLLGDLGIKPLDFEKRISKEHRHDQWITEINLMLVTGVELINRPINWIDYLDEVLVLRKLIVETLRGFIQLIDNFYKKRYWDDTKAKNTLSKVQSLQELFIKDHLLPKNALDPYGINSESSTIDSNTLPQNVNISVQPYKKFRTSLREVVSGLQNFFNQFVEVIVSHLRNEEVHSDLSLINIYEAVKGMQTLQKEFGHLFLSYADPDYSKFSSYEIELMLTTLNMWESVIEQKPRGFGLSYSAEQKHKKSEKIITDCFQEVLSSLGRKISVFRNPLEGDNGTIFLLFEDSISDENTIEEQYKFLCNEFQKSWSSALNFNSLRWLLETQWPRMIFVPLHKGLPILGGFEMPMYRILDATGDQLFSSMFPAEIPQELNQFHNSEALLDLGF